MMPSRRQFVRVVLLALALCSRTMHAAQATDAFPQPQPRIITATAVVSGRVTDNAGVPIRSAEVRLRSNDGHDSRIATTDSAGLYEIRDLVSGQWSLEAFKAGYFSPSPSGRPANSAVTGVMLANGQRLSVNLSLSRAGAIAGRILDDAGEPLADVQVQAFKLGEPGDGYQAIGMGVPDTSDDTGAFRLYAIPPGTYYVRAQAPFEREFVMPTRDANGLVNGTVGGKRDIFYPSAADPANAEPLKVVAGQDQTGIVIVIPQPTAGVRVTGTILSGSGEPVGNDVSVELMRPSATGPAGAGLIGRVSNGRFAIEGVPPGDYVLSALGPPSRVQSWERGSLPLSVGTAPLDDVAITMTPTRTVKGEVIADHDVQTPSFPVTVTLRTFDSPIGGDSFTVRAPGEFSLPGVWGKQAVTVTGLPRGWMVKTIEIAGYELGSGPFDFSGVPGAATLQVVVTNRVGELSGMVESTPQGERTVVIVFPDDETKWRSPSRYVTAVTTDDDGAFHVSGLNAMRYLAVAVPWLNASAAVDPALLSQLKRTATAFTIGEGEKKTLAVPFVQR